jgi:elongator complex protein 3
MNSKYIQNIKMFFKDINNKDLTKQQFENKKVEFAKKYHLKKLPLTSDILNSITTTNIPSFLVTKPSRTKSGVTVIAIMIKPHHCPGKCIYCPNSKKAPKSYTGFEPAAMRAIRNNFDAYKQIKDRLKQFTSIGHPTNKLEVIIMGGTFPATTQNYQNKFITDMYQAITDSKSKNLEFLKKKAMYSEKRIVGLTFETRPDYCDDKIITQFLNYGGTRVEIGVQIADDKVLKFVDRGHGIKEIIDTTRNLKDAGFKVLYHVMLGLPSSNYKNDLKRFKELFANPDYCPDMLKIYPCLVTKDTIIEKMLYKGEYTPYDTNIAIKLIADMKEFVPKWVRIMRIQRDIPTTQIIAGVYKSNLRQLVEKELISRNKKCNCIRCSEPRDKDVDIKDYKIKKIKYSASKGTEYFIYAEKENYLLGFIRLRFPYQPFIKEINNKTTLVRELHVYGQSTKFKSKNIQHTGIGKKLLKIAEEISLKNDFNKISVISGIGVREYYKKQGYYLDNNYMSKTLLKK